MKDRLLTLDNLYEYYVKKNKSYHFSADNDENVIVVQSPAVLKFSEEEVTEGLTKVVLQACHTDKNLNSSSIKLAKSTRDFSREMNWRK